YPEGDGLPTIRYYTTRNSINLEMGELTKRQLARVGIDLDVIPVNIRARNSALFYLFDLLHPTLRDITLFYETLNKARQPFRLTVGRPIPSAHLSRNSSEAIEELRSRTLRLGGKYAPAVSLVEQTRGARWVRGLLAGQRAVRLS
ncbi:MAG: hypothetical protein AAGL98_09155, partial [Planctomycetota bacterium]